MTRPGVYSDDELRVRFGMAALPAIRAVESTIAALLAVVCPRCGRRRDRWPADESCCTWWGTYRGRHRKASRS